MALSFNSSLLHRSPPMILGPCLDHLPGHFLVIGKLGSPVTIYCPASSARILIRICVRWNCLAAALGRSRCPRDRWAYISLPLIMEDLWELHSPSRQQFPGLPLEEAIDPLKMVHHLDVTDASPQLDFETCDSHELQTVAFQYGGPTPRPITSNMSGAPSQAIHAMPV